MKLAVDFGNTNIKIAVFNEKKLEYFISTKRVTNTLLKTLVRKYKIEAAIISSVVNNHASAEIFLKKQVPTIMLTHKTKVPIQNKYQTPQTLGMDRLANIMGAYSFFKNENIFVISAGTCITYDMVSANAVYWGGNITPGLQMRLSAMHQFTHRLPQLKFQNTKKLSGASTKESMLSGVAKGAEFEMEGFIASCKKEFKNLKVIITGGDASFFVSQIKSPIFARPHLVLYGLNEILDFNA